LGDTDAHTRFAKRLLFYSDRARDNGKVDRPPTFEVDLAQKIPFDDETIAALRSALIEPSNAVVRKHALILLWRSDKPLSPVDVARYCTRETVELSKAVRSPGTDDAARDALVRSLLYGLKALAQFGTDTDEEADVTRAISQELIAAGMMSKILFDQLGDPLKPVAYEIARYA
jgi:hypothetical protein